MSFEFAKLPDEAKKAAFAAMDRVKKGGKPRAGGGEKPAAKRSAAKKPAADKDYTPEQYKQGQKLRAAIRQMGEGYVKQIMRAARTGQGVPLPSNWRTGQTRAAADKIDAALKRGRRTK